MQQILLRAKGLYTHPNDMGSATPDGAMAVADNVVIDRDEIAEPRRGFHRSSGAFSDSSFRANKLFLYQNYLLAHYSTNLLAYYSARLSDGGFTTSGSWTAISGTYAAPTGYKVRSTEANQNFYLTTSEGIKKLDAFNGAVSSAGAPKALDVTLSTQNITGNWLSDDYRVAYRLLWGYRDVNNNLILSTPSQRSAITNSAGSTRAVRVNSTIPSGITTAWFYQVYRSASVDTTTVADAEPNDELGLVYEANVSSTDLSNGYIEFDDITPESLRGATIYTAATQEGLANSNEPPPWAVDIATYKNTAFYANIDSKQRLYITLLGAPSTQANASISIGGVRYVGASSASHSTAQFLVSTGGSASQNIADTAQNLVACINKYSGSQVYAYYLSSADELPGKILLESRTITGAAFHVACVDDTYWSPELTEYATVTFTASTDKVNWTAHGKSNGNQIVFHASNGATMPTGLSANTIYYVVNAATNDFQVSLTSGGAAVNFTTDGSGTLVANLVSQYSKSDRFKNGVMFSKTNEPEAVPLTNLFFVGRAQDEILRIVPLRDSLFVFKKEDGIYRLSGEDASSFRVDLFDSSTRLLAPESAAVLGNQIYCLTDQGVVAVSEAGVQVRSRPIETALTDLLASNPTVYKGESFGISYETERKYILFVPTTSSDSAPTQAFVFNTFTNTWTRWDLAKKCGLVAASDDKLYLGDSDNAFVNQERKSLTSKDYGDYAGTATINSINGVSFTMADTADLEEGDVLYQSDSVYAVIEEIDTATDIVTMSADPGFTTGSKTVFRAVQTRVQWLPLVANNPGSFKHFREVTVLFKEEFIGAAALHFSSDISASTEIEEIAGSTEGSWGLFPWGQAPWGGSDVSRQPIRVFVPRNKQRCTQLNVAFVHNRAFSAYQLTGLSIILNPGSERVEY